MSEVRPFGVGSEAVSEVSRFLACEVRPLPPGIAGMWSESTEGDRWQSKSFHGNVVIES